MYTCYHEVCWTYTNTWTGDGRYVYMSICLYVYSMCILRTCMMRVIQHKLPTDLYKDSMYVKFIHIDAKMLTFYVCTFYLYRYLRTYSHMHTYIHTYTLHNMHTHISYLRIHIQVSVVRLRRTNYLYKDICKSYRCKNAYILHVRIFTQIFIYSHTCMHINVPIYTYHIYTFRCQS